ncbi:MAG: hypothetical protein M3O82_02215 [Verrucomicrobiota bacterium]|nr:hypothetical protein [Verrucomicrobiota bacterium]
MKLFLLSLLAICALAGCDNKPRSTASDTAPSEQEIERRVQERLAEERRADEAQRLKDREQQVAAREAALAQRESAPKTQTFEQVSEERIEPETAAPTTSYDLFYKALGTDGDWIETDTYGYVWRPNVAVRNPAWRPYTFGHWAETDYGWTWVSDEPFGWATYHYGRWARLRGIGWAWVPGDDWAPAWVSWRYSDDYVGWAPLPPEAQDDSYGDSVDTSYGLGAVQYIFVPVPEFCAPSIQQVIFAPQQNITIFNRTVNVTNITVKGRVVINRGPKLDAIKKASRHPVEQLTLEKVTTPGAKPVRPVVAGNRLQVSAPVVQRGSAKPDKVKATVTNVQPEVSPVIARRPAQTPAAQNATPVAAARPTAPLPLPPSQQPIVQQPVQQPPQNNQQLLQQQRQLELQRQRAEAARRSPLQNDPTTAPQLSPEARPDAAAAQQQEILQRQQQAAQQLRMRQAQAAEQLRARQEQLQQQREAAAERMARQPDREIQQPPRVQPPLAQPVVEQPKPRPAHPAVSVPSVSP